MIAVVDIIIFDLKVNEALDPITISIITKTTIMNFHNEHIANSIVMVIFAAVTMTLHYLF